MRQRGAAAGPRLPVRSPGRGPVALHDKRAAIRPRGSEAALAVVTELDAGIATCDSNLYQGPHLERLAPIQANYLQFHGIRRLGRRDTQRAAVGAEAEEELRVEKQQ